jgi:hypothetical protein
MPPQLLALNEGPSILLDKPILLVGRHQECDVQLPSRKISRRHCCIAQVSDYLVVRDLASTNGIRINGVRVIEGCLRAGDELTIGSYRYEVRWNAQAPVPMPRPAAREGIRHVRASPPPVEDDPLESCDEPVALQEPDEQAPPRRAPIFPAGLPPSAPRVDKPAAPAPKPQSPIRPDNLDLAPSRSDNPPPPASGG